MAITLCRFCKDECIDPVEASNGIHNACADAIEKGTEWQRQQECLAAHRERSVRDLMDAARDILIYMDEAAKPRLGVSTHVQRFAWEYVTGKLRSALEEVDQYDETDDPAAMGWVGKGGRP